LDDSEVNRTLFAHALRETGSLPNAPPRFLKLKPNDFKNLKIFLKDNTEHEDVRAMAALYAGAHGDKNLTPELEDIASESTVVGQAANVALKMLKDRPTFRIPTLQPKAEI
jgi:hypothetical protein